MKPAELHFFIDPNRCIGCQACVQACSECDTHRGESMIHLEYIDRANSVQTVPVICMHCEQPTCAEVCPADAIKRTADGVVQSARKPRCIACGNCVMACPFGVPEVYEDRQLMMKCDMCYDRTSVGKKPMCATVCPSQALFFGTREQLEQMRPQSMPVNAFQFGNQTITTRVFTMVPKVSDKVSEERGVKSKEMGDRSSLASPHSSLYLDVTAAMEEEASARNPRNVRLSVIGEGQSGGRPEPISAGPATDPFAEVEI
jgi:Fe-S-cluster-containing dehydrogenase component